MNVLAFASRKGGAGKSTLAAPHADKHGRACLLIDDDPQGSLTLWNEMRQDAALPVKTVKRRIADVVKKADRQGVDWVFIDTPANLSACVVETIEAATLVIIPCRPGVFDIDAVQHTIELARHARTPYAGCRTKTRRARNARSHLGPRVPGASENPSLGWANHPQG